MYTGSELNPICQQFWATMTGPPPEMGGQTPYPPGSVLAQDDVRYVGDPVAIVLASSRYVAEDAADLVVVDIEPSAPVLGLRAAATNPELVHRELTSNVSATMPMPVGVEIDALFAGAAHLVTRTFSGARATNAPMEPRGIVVSYDRHRGEMEIRSATQSVHEVKVFVARLTGVPESHIRAVADDVGGGFGQKMMIMREEAAVIAAAFKLGTAPVKWIEDRRENLIASNQARPDEAKMTLAIDDEGHILAVNAHLLEESGPSPVVGRDRRSLSGSCPAPDILGFPGAHGLHQHRGKAAFRGPWAIETIAREQMMDAAARELGLDTLEFRRATSSPVRAAVHHPDRDGLDVMTPKRPGSSGGDAGLGGVPVQQADARERPAARSGTQRCVEPSAVAFGAYPPRARWSHRRSASAGAVGTGSHGHSLETTIAQVVGDHLGCDIDDVIVRQGGTPPSGLAPAGAAPR